MKHRHQEKMFSKCGWKMIEEKRETLVQIVTQKSPRESEKNIMQHSTKEQETNTALHITTQQNTKKQGRKTYECRQSNAHPFGGAPQNICESTNSETTIKSERVTANREKHLQLVE